MHQHSNYKGPRRRREKEKKEKKKRNYKGPRRRREKKKKIFEEIVVENVPNTGKEIVNQVQEAQRLPYKINPRRNMPRHIFIKLSKIKYKEKTIKSRKGKTTNDIQENPHKVNS